MGTSTLEFILAGRVTALRGLFPLVGSSVGVLPTPSTWGTLVW